MINTVTLCGSTRFLNEFHEANVELTKRGLSVITISMALPKNEQNDCVEKGLKDLFDLIHFNKILRSDAVFVVGDGYIGWSTAREVLWAEMQEKPVFARTQSFDWDLEASIIKLGGAKIDIYNHARKVLGIME